MTAHIALFVAALTACTSGQTPPAPATPEPPPEPEPVVTDSPSVVEIAVRRLNQGQDVDAFSAARDAFVGKLKGQSGVGTDREFQSFFDYGTNAPTAAPGVYVGMTQYDSLDAFEAASDALAGSAELGAFFATFEPQLFTVLEPLKEGAPVDLAGIANQEDQVLEIALRDLSKYENFDAADYAAKRDAFLETLSQQPGFVAEYQWVSALDPNIAVGMTVYENQGAFVALSQNAAFGQSEAVAGMLGTYPPNLGGHINTVVK